MGLQVYTATHDGEGNSLSVMDKHFISFSYGGKNIEDFNLLSVTTGERISRNFSAAFKNITTQYDGLDGQLFWISNYEPLRITFNLATDGMNERDINNFKRHFQPGIEKELILSEHPNRYIMARIEAAPSYTFLPFEKEETIQLSNNITKTIRTTEYRGEASITFVMDKPFWYSKENYLNVPILNNLKEEQLKIYFEDGVPISSKIPNNIILAEEVVKINGSFKTLENAKITIGPDIFYYLYNPSSAPVKPEITFTFKPTYLNGYIDYPANKFSSSELESSFDYSSISIGDKIFKYTTPSILTAINQAIRTANDFKNSGKTSIIDLFAEMREKVFHREVRIKVMEILDGWLTTGSGVVNIQTGQLINNWNSVFSDLLLPTIPENLTVSFNSETGEAKISYIFNGKSIEENAGDMIKSGYLILEGHPFKTDGSMIETKECLAITSSREISNFKINYRYTYL